MKQLLFTDSMTWNGTEKTAVSVRDGVIEYSGAELGMEPADQIFTVYRSPATIAKAAAAIVGMPLIEGHIDPDIDPEPNTVGGKVTSSEVIDHFAADTNSNLAVKNTIEISDAFTDVLNSGKRELSLGYKGRLVEHDVYDFEQRDIIPKHLAVVPAGRCGAVCSFIDGKEVLPMIKKTKKKLAKSFLDEDGQPNMEQIVEIAQSLPDALKELSIDKLKEVLPTLQNIIAESGVKPVIDDEVIEATDEEIKDEEVVVDEDAKATDEEAKDEKGFEDAVGKILARHTEVIEKARSFVDEGVSFAGKSTTEIMRIAVAAQYSDQKFTDAELPIAFKMLKQRATDLTNFGDAAVSKPQTLTERVAQYLED